MRPWMYPLAALALLGTIALVPAWMHFVDRYAPNLPTEMMYLAQFTLPALLMLFIASWLNPWGDPT